VENFKQGFWKTFDSQMFGELVGFFSAILMMAGAVGIIATCVFLVVKKLDSQ